MLDPDTTSRAFELIDASAARNHRAVAEILALIPPPERSQVAGFALGLLGAIYQQDPIGRQIIDEARRATGDSPGTVTP